MHRRRRTLAAAATLLAAALAGAACGDDEPATAAPPELAQGVGKVLSARANDVAKRLEDGRDCAAADDVRELREMVERRIGNERIPGELQDPLLSGVDALLGRIDCVERVTETVTVPAEPEIVTTTTTEPPEEGEGSGGTEPSQPEEDSGSGGGDSGSGGGPDETVPPGQEKKNGGGGSGEGE